MSEGRRERDRDGNDRQERWREKREMPKRSIQEETASDYLLLGYPDALCLLDGLSED